MLEILNYGNGRMEDKDRGGGNEGEENGLGMKDVKSQQMI